MSLFDILGVNTDNLAAVGDYLKKYYIESGAELARMEHARLLDEFCAGDGDDEMGRVIDKMYNDPRNRKRRRAVIEAGLDKWDNIISRIVSEKATVYSEPAKRKIAQGDESYQEFNEAVGMDAVMGELDKKLALHENALLWYRVRVSPSGEREPVLEVVSPASFWAVCHPKDRTLLVAIILDQRMPLASPGDPAFRVWCHDQTFVMNGKCEIFETSVELWPLGTMPGVLASVVKPGAKPTLLTQKPSADLLSAQKAIRLQAINLAKESVSAVNQTYISGDTSATAMGQTADTESEVFLGEGVSATTLDRGMDQEQFRDNGGYVGDAVASNHGLAPSVLRNRDASSGAEIELRRLPIREQRKKRIPIMRAVERSIVRIIALVNGRQVTPDEGGEPMLVGDLPQYAFNPEGWSIDFGEVQQPMSKMESLQAFEKERELGAKDNYEWEMERNPDIRTLEEAKRVVDERTQRRTQYIQSQKDLMAASGALGAAAPMTPFEANRGQLQNQGGQESTQPKEVA